ncbi:MAG TPA: hypothetical protein ENK35_12910 [Candidatus Tenderia sp.]|nr:hypothetical protein [Candidatus Tenderia sp.]
MMKKSLLNSAIIAGLLPLSASALDIPDLNEARPNQFSYNYAEIEYVDMDSGLDGFRLSASYDIKPNLALTGSLLRASVSRLDYNLVSVGAAYHARWVEFEQSDLIIHASLVNADLSRSDSELGVTFGAKVRASIKEELEIFGDLNYTTVLDGDLSLNIGAAYTFAPDLAATLNYQLTDDDALSIGLRYYFP